MIVAYTLLFSAAFCSLPMAVAIKGEGKKVRVFTGPFIAWSVVTITLFTFSMLAAKHWWEVEFWSELLWIWLVAAFWDWLYYWGM